MSVRWRILGAFLLIILLTVLIGIGFDYWSSEKELAEFSTKIRTEDLADIISQQYTKDKGWDGLAIILEKYGLTYESEKILADDAVYDEFAVKEAWRVIVRDIYGTILIDTHENVDIPSTNLRMSGDPAVIRDLESDEEVGSVALAINQDYIIAETRRYLASLVIPRLFQGIVTALIAMLVGIWLSRRITAPVTALTKATQVIAESGKTQRLPVNSSDELGQMSQSFNQMMTSLEVQRNLRKRLIDDVAHEFSTPLSVIRLEAKGLQDDIKPPQEAAQQIIGEVDLLSNLVYDLNWLAETDSGELRLDVESHGYGDFLKTEVERWQMQAQAKDIALSFESTISSDSAIQLDANRMSQVIGNLIENAIQHTPREGRIKVQCEIEESTLVTSVCDTGEGIPEDDLDHIFERFYRVDASRHRNSGGRGLGLAIVKQIIEAHDGKLWVESEIGKGSCIFFSLGPGIESVE